MRVYVCAPSSVFEVNWVHIMYNMVQCLYVYTYRIMMLLFVYSGTCMFVFSCVRLSNVVTVVCLRGSAITTCFCVYGGMQVWWHVCTCLCTHDTGKDTLVNIFMCNMIVCAYICTTRLFVYCDTFIHMCGHPRACSKFIVRIVFCGTCLYM